MQSVQNRSNDSPKSTKRRPRTIFLTAPLDILPAEGHARLHAAPRGGGFSLPNSAPWGPSAGLETVRRQRGTKNWPPGR
eukprot:7596282-Pyramimonas_sp.AAC.1